MVRTFPNIGGGGSSDSSESTDSDDSDATDYEEANQGGTGSFGDRPDDSTDETESDPTDQPARGRDTETGGQTDSPTYDSDPSYDDDSGDGDTESDPADQPARGRDTQTGGQTDSPTYDTEPDSDTDSDTTADPVTDPEPSQPARGRGGTGTSDDTADGTDDTTSTTPGDTGEDQVSGPVDPAEDTMTPAEPGSQPGPGDTQQGEDDPQPIVPEAPRPAENVPASVVEDLDRQIENQAGETLERGEEYIITEEEGQFEAVPTPGFRREQIREQTAGQSDELTQDDIAVQFTTSGAQIQYSDSYRADLREQAAEEFSEGTAGMTFSEGDVRLQETNEGIELRLTETAQNEYEQQQRERIADQIREEAGLDDPEDVLTPQERRRFDLVDASAQEFAESRTITADNFTEGGDLTEEGEDIVAAARLDEAIAEVDVSPEDVSREQPSRLNPTRAESFTLTPEAQTEIRTDQALAELQGQTETTLTESDIQVQPGESVALTDQALNEEAAEQFTREEFTVGDATVDTTAFERGEDFTVEDGEPQLTAEGRKMLIRSRVAQEGIETQQDEFSLLGVTLREEGTETRDIEDLSRLEFDEEGNLTGVSEQEDATFGEIQERIEEGAEFLPDTGTLYASQLVESTAPALAGSRKGVDIAGDISGDVAEGFSEEVAQPGSEVVGDVFRGAGETGMAIRGLYGDVDQDLESDVETVASGAENLSRGVLETGSLALGIGETVETGTRVAGESGAFAVEEGVGESVEATADVTSDVAIQTAEQTVENPLRTVGTLAGTAAIMGGAARISGRAGTATRYAIQPGEEIVGTVGSRATAAVSPRASRALFPQGEPLLLSEEAAIAGARATGRGISSAGQRIRRAIEEPSTQFDATPRQRALVSEFRPRGATEVQQTVEDVGPGAPIGRGGELGAETESALDALEGVNVEQPASRPGEVEIEQTSDVSNMRASEQPSPGRRFLEGERGQASLVPRGRTETESETDVQEPFSGFEPSRSEILEGGTRDILRQEMQGRQLTQRRQLGGEFEGDFNPVGEAEARREQAQRREVRVGEEVETRAEPIRTELPQDDVTAGADQRLQVAQTPQVRTGVDLATEIGEDVGVEPLQSPLTDVEPRTDSVARTDLEQGVRFEREQEAETETDTELERELEAEAELEAELESELETELELEAETLPQKDDQRRRSDPRQTGIYADLFENPVVAPGELDEVLDAGE